MDYLNMPGANKDNFNWDDIDVGNHALDHSQKFFANKHIKHERLDESEEGMDLLTEIDALTLDDTFKPSQGDKENANILSTPKSFRKSPLKEITAQTISNEGNKAEEAKPKGRARINPGIKIENEEAVTKCKSTRYSPTKEEELQPTTTNPVNFTDSLIARNRARINPGKQIKTSPPDSSLAADPEPAQSNAIVLSESLITRAKARINPGVKKEKVDNTATTANTAAANGSCQTGAMAKSVTAPAPAAPTTPHAYQCSEVYKRRKAELLRKREDEERKMRQFHSRPVPNFNAHHKSLQAKMVKHAVTVPVTPVVLKHHRDGEEKRKQKLEELKKMHPLRLEPRPPTAVYEEPFVPKKLQTTSVLCPFNLRSERRGQERKQYDANVQRAIEEKQRQVEIVSETNDIIDVRVCYSNVFLVILFVYVRKF